MELREALLMILNLGVLYDASRDPFEAPFRDVSLANCSREERLKG